MKKLLFALLLSVLFLSPESRSDSNHENNIKMDLIPESDLFAGISTKIKLNLSEIKTGKLVSDSDLKIVHTKKLHLLIIDPSLTDFQHIHPSPTKNAGEFSFNFTPKMNGNYRFWADITPINGNHEYVIADLGKASEKTKIDKTINTEAEVDGYKFNLLFDSNLVASKASIGSLKVQEKDGKDVTNLEPVLGAFAHIVVFSEDYKTIVHVHPMGKEPENETERGGPEIQFHIEPETAGFVKMFVQVKINGKDIFVPFGLNVGNAVALK